MIKSHIYFSDFFDIDPVTLEEHGALNISLINDLPLFVDPFLLFNSSDEHYQRLHDRIVEYVRFLQKRAKSGIVDTGLLSAWFMFSEVKQNWLGYSLVGNRGSGLGMGFANSLHSNLHTTIADFGNESITIGSHLEKLCLVREGVGRDNISDFTTNLIKDYLLEYTQTVSFPVK